MYGTAQRQFDAPAWVAVWQTTDELTESVQMGVGACKLSHP